MNSPKMERRRQKFTEYTPRERGEQDSKGDTVYHEAVVSGYSYRAEQGSMGVYRIFPFLVILCLPVTGQSGPMAILGWVT